MLAVPTPTKQDEHALREREALLVGREAELLRAQTELRVVDAVALRGRLRRARLSLPAEAAEQMDVTLRYVTSGPADVPAAIRAHRLACVELEAKTAALWLETIATDDVARRGGLLSKIGVQLQLRSRALLAWQRTIDDARRRRYMAGELSVTLDPPSSPPPAESTFERQERGSGVVLHAPPGEDPCEPRTMPARPSLAEPKRVCASPASRDPSERRITARLPMAEPVVLGVGERSAYTGFTENISESGLFVASFHVPLPVGEVCLLAFEMASGNSVRAEAVVCWQRGWNRETPDVVPGLGLKFLGLTPDQEERIDAYVAREGALFHCD